MDTYSNRGDLVSCVRFVAAGANPVVVETSLNVTSVTWTGLGQYTVTLTRPIDRNNRGVSFGTRAPGPTDAQERGVGSDSTIEVLVSAAGLAVDNGAAITVKVHRTSIG